MKKKFKYFTKVAKKKNIYLVNFFSLKEHLIFMINFKVRQIDWFPNTQESSIQTFQPFFYHH